MAIGFGTVAENISVRRSAGAAPRMNSRSSRKPRSSISSASSSTTTRTDDISSEPRRMWSHRRPGVPTTMCAPSQQRAALLAHVHAADAGRRFWRRSARRATRVRGAPATPARASARRPASGVVGAAGDCRKPLGVPEQRRRHREAERHGLAGAGLRGNQQVGAIRFGSQNRRLDGGERGIAAFRQGASKHWGNACKNCHNEILSVLNARSAPLLEQRPASSDRFGAASRKCLSALSCEPPLPSNPPYRLEIPR